MLQGLQRPLQVGAGVLLLPQLLGHRGRVCDDLCLLLRSPRIPAGVFNLALELCPVGLQLTLPSVPQR